MWMEIEPHLLQRGQKSFDISYSPPLEQAQAINLDLYKLICFFHYGGIIRLLKKHNINAFVCICMQVECICYSQGL